MPAKPPSPAQIAYAKHLLKQVGASEPDWAKLDSGAVSALIDELKAKRGRPVWYGNGQFSHWEKAAGGPWYHGAKQKYDVLQSRRWSPHDGPAHDVPVFLTQDKSFAKLYAGYHGYIYEVRPDVHKTFDGENMVKPGAKYWPPERGEMTPEGQKLYDDLEANKIYPGLVPGDPNSDDFGETLKAILKMNYDAMENGHMVRWLRASGYDSFYVTGDGPKNLAVMDPKKIEVLSVEPVAKEASARVAAKFAAKTDYFKVGDPILFGKYKNKRGIIVRVFEDEKGHPSIEIEPVPKGRKKNKTMGLYKIWHDPDPPEPEEEDGK